MEPVQLELIQAPSTSGVVATDAQLPTNLTTHRHPIHRWFNFIAGFSPEFVRQCVNEAGLGRGSRLIDPFAGLGTALVESNFLGIESVGYEPHPFFADMLRAKVDPASSAPEVEALTQMLLEIGPLSPDHIWDAKPLQFLRSLIPEPELRLLAGAQQREASGVSDRLLYRLIVSRALEAAAGSQTDGIYKAPTTRKRSTPFHAAIRTTSKVIAEDLADSTATYSRLATVHESSSEDMSALPDGSMDIAVTSPPYLNNFDFAEMTRMEFYYWKYASSWREITESIRQLLIVNTTTAPTWRKVQQDRYRETLPPQFRVHLDSLVAELAVMRKLRAGHKDYDRLVYPYFSQMQAVLDETFRVLKSGASFHMVVADAALYGVHIQTEMLLAELMRSAGFEVAGIKRFRDRGHRWVLAKRTGPGRPLGEFHIHARRS